MEQGAQHHPAVTGDKHTDLGKQPAWAASWRGARHPRGPKPLLQAPRPQADSLIPTRQCNHPEICVFRKEKPHTHTNIITHHFLEATRRAGF